MRRDLEKHIRGSSKSNESFRRLEPTIPCQKDVIHPHQLHGKVVLLTRYHAATSATSDHHASEANTERIHPMRYVSVAAQNRRRRVWKSIFTQHLQHLQHLQHKPAGPTSPTSPVSSVAASKRRDPNPRLSDQVIHGDAALTAGRSRGRRMVRRYACDDAAL